MKYKELTQTDLIQIGRIWGKLEESIGEDIDKLTDAVLETLEIFKDIVKEDEDHEDD